MLTALLVVAAIALQPPAPSEIERLFSDPVPVPAPSPVKGASPEAPAGPSVSPPPIAAGKCPEGCDCPFPGACGHKGCVCAPKAGWTPPRDEWRPFTDNPAWEVFGRLDSNGVFRYTKSRLRQSEVKLGYQCVSITEKPHASGRKTYRLERLGNDTASTPWIDLNSMDPRLERALKVGSTVVLSVSTPGRGE